jgi:hypothetical protein
MAAARNPEQPAPAQPSATDRLQAAQAALAEVNARIAELDQQCNAALLEDRNADAIALAVQVTNLKVEARAHAKKIELLREKAEKEAAERRAAEKAALIEKIEKKIEQRDAAMTAVADAVKQLAKASERAIELGREIVSEWQWLPHDISPALLSPAAIMTAISHELFKVSHRPRFYGGRDGPLAGVSLPGSRAPTLQLAEDPARVRPMADVVREASEFARRFLHTGKGSAGVEVVAAPVSTNGKGDAPGPQIGKPLSDLGSQRSDAEQRLSNLLAQMAKLAEDGSEEGERRYHEVVGEIARLQGAQHG